MKVLSFFLPLSILLLVTISTPSVNTQTITDLNKVKQQLLNTWYSTSTTNVQAWAKSLSAEGKWSDIDYTNGYNTPPNTHLVRIQHMAAAYATSANPLYHNSSILAACSSALNFWNNNKGFVQGNWWWNRIGYPDVLGPICMLLQPQLTTPQHNNCSAYLLAGSTSGMTGANLIWTAQVQIYQAAFVSNVTWAAVNFKLIYGEIVYTNGAADGVKVDGSFFQHTVQEYSGGYGFDFTVQIIAVASCAEGTAFAMPESVLGVFATHVLDGQQWMMHLPTRRFDASVKGREITRSADGPPSPFQIENYGGARAAEWKMYYERMTGSESATPRIGNRNYWKSDYMVHSRANYMATVKMFSTRTANSECVNSEGKQSVYLSSGVNYIMTDGSEYAGSWVLWDWELVPGTTVERGANSLVCNQVYQLGKTSFVGVVSDSQYGSAAHDLHGPWSSTVVAKKSWFFFDEEYVCLGSGIHTASGKTVVTTLEQNNLKGVVSSSASANIPQSKTTLTGISWLFHRTAGYIFPSTATVQLNTLQKTGNWDTININNLAATGSTFQAYIEHDATKVASTAGDSYAYIVVPGTNSSTFAAKQETIKNSIQIIANTQELHAVYHNVLHHVRATFWSATVFKHPTFGYTVSAMQPCLLMLSQSSATSPLKISVSDPTQKLPHVELNIGLQLTCNGCSYNTANKTTTYTAALPTGEFAGNSVTITASIPAVKIDIVD